MSANNSPTTPDVSDPILYGRLRLRREWSGGVCSKIEVWRPGCDDTHEHGWDAPNAISAYTHKAAHGQLSSPYRATG